MLPLLPLADLVGRVDLPAVLGLKIGFRLGVLFLPLISQRSENARQFRTDLAADLNVDSVAAMDLIMEIEDRFEIDIPINLVSDMTTVADLAALVERQIKSRKGG